MAVLIPPSEDKSETCMRIKTLKAIGQFKGSDSISATPNTVRWLLTFWVFAWGWQQMLFDQILKVVV